MRCTWCGGEHRSDQHYILGRRPRWYEETYQFREPGDTRTSGTIITLTDLEIERAKSRARTVMRDDHEWGFGMRHAPPKGETEFDVKARGFGAELAAHRVTGLELHWEMLTRTYKRKNKPPDLGKRTEVRNSAKQQGPLKAHDTDPTGRIFLLVTGTLPVFDVRGWLEGADLMADDNWFEPWKDWLAHAADLNALPLPDDA